MDMVNRKRMGCVLTWAKDMLESLKNFGNGGGAEVERASRKTVLFMVDMDNDKQDKDYGCVDKGGWKEGWDDQVTDSAGLTCR